MITAVGVDFQRDFCDEEYDNYKPALPVKGGSAAAKAFSYLISGHRGKINELILTHDTHPLMHIAHNVSWKGNDGNPLAPYTVLTPEALDSEVAPLNSENYYEYSRYLKEVQMMTIWPPHCVIGTVGAALDHRIALTSKLWAYYHQVEPIHIVKGRNLYTDQYGALEAVVPQRGDQSTQFNTTFMARLMQSNLILWGGLALDYCLSTTMEQAFEAEPKLIEKSILLKNATASVDPGATPGILQKFAADGVRLSTTEEVFAA